MKLKLRIVALTFLTFLAFQTAPQPTSAGLSTTVSLSGTVLSFDREALLLRDGNDLLWKIPIRVLKKGFDLKSNQHIKLEVERTELTFERVIHQQP